MLWRHGRTAWNSAGRFQGQLDVGLDEVGVEQAARAARLLAALPPDAIICSDLDRARTTATALVEICGLPLAVHEGLRETYAGSWQGMLARDIESTDGAVYADWHAGREVRPGGGETRAEVAARALAAVTPALAALPPNGVLVATTHGGTARALIGRMLGLPVESWAALGGLANCSWSVLEELPGGRWRLSEHNAGTLPEPVMGDDD